jgi:hypothetical protein
MRLLIQGEARWGRDSPVCPLSLRQQLLRGVGIWRFYLPRYCLLRPAGRNLFLQKEWGFLVDPWCPTNPHDFLKSLITNN